jgi:hypothetical protein
VERRLDEVPASAVRAATTTAAPAWPKRRAISAPMPRLAPVTMATLPSKIPMSALLAAASRPAVRKANPRRLF